MRAPAKPKPKAVDEAARVIRIFGWLIGESTKVPREAALIVAERIAARTED